MTGTKQVFYECTPVGYKCALGETTFFGFSFNVTQCCSTNLCNKDTSIATPNTMPTLPEFSSTPLTTRVLTTEPTSRSTTTNKTTRCSILSCLFQGKNLRQCLKLCNIC